MKRCGAPVLALTLLNHLQKGGPIPAGTKTPKSRNTRRLVESQSALIPGLVRSSCFDFKAPGHIRNGFGQSRTALQGSASELRSNRPWF